ncbi:hypothetical protein HPG69_000383 [Diceros bicornis minor]|uniref:Serine/threonine-protein kinase LMTK3 n=1 Tax=Diceros bicornis minor TaxID=77932 RepID=A0A7J7FCU1_DICBM|nr:hypothetical protein HPG69_000383 [Diceros bicornis minor]
MPAPGALILLAAVSASGCLASPAHPGESVRPSGCPAAPTPTPACPGVCLRGSGCITCLRVFLQPSQGLRSRGDDGFALGRAPLAPPYAVVLISCSGLLAFIFLLLTCLCCKRGDVGFKEFENPEGEDCSGEYTPPAEETSSSQSLPDVYILPLAEVSLPMPAPQPSHSGTAQHPDEDPMVPRDVVEGPESLPRMLRPRAAQGKCRDGSRGILEAACRESQIILVEAIAQSKTSCGDSSGAVHDMTTPLGLSRQHLSYLQEIGSGWFGKVILGEIFSDYTPAQVVVKELRASAGPLEQRKFISEAQPYRYDILQSCWQPPAQRPSASELQLQLTYLLSERPPRPPPPPPPPRDGPFPWPWPPQHSAPRPGTLSSPFPLLDGFPGADPDDVLTVTESSRGLNLECLWEKARRGAGRGGGAPPWQPASAPPAPHANPSNPFYEALSTPSVLPVISARSPSVSSEYYIRLEEHGSPPEPLFPNDWDPLDPGVPAPQAPQAPSEVPQLVSETWASPLFPAPRPFPAQSSASGSFLLSGWDPEGRGAGETLAGDPAEVLGERGAGPWAEEEEEEEEGSSPGETSSSLGGGPSRRGPLPCPLCSREGACSCLPLERGDAVAGWGGHPALGCPHPPEDDSSLRAERGSLADLPLAPPTSAPPEFLDPLMGAAAPHGGRAPVGTGMAPAGGLGSGVDAKAGWVDSTRPQPLPPPPAEAQQRRPEPAPQRARPEAAPEGEPGAPDSRPGGDTAPSGDADPPKPERKGPEMPRLFLDLGPPQGNSEQIKAKLSRLSLALPPLTLTPFPGPGPRRPPWEGADAGAAGGEAGGAGAPGPAEEDGEDEDEDEEEEDEEAAAAGAAAGPRGPGRARAAPVPVVVSSADADAARPLRGLLKSPRGADEPEDSELERKRKMVSFHGDVTVYLFDQETPTNELSVQGPPEGDTDPSTPPAPPTPPHPATPGDGFPSNDSGFGGSFEWAEDFPLLPPPGPPLCFSRFSVSPALETPGPPARAPDARPAVYTPMLTSETPPNSGTG